MTSLLKGSWMSSNISWQVSHCDMLCFIFLHLGAAKSSYRVKETRDKVLNQFQSSFGTKFGLWRFWIRTCSFALSTGISISRDREECFSWPVELSHTCDNRVILFPQVAGEARWPAVYFCPPNVSLNSLLTVNWLNRHWLDAQKRWKPHKHSG